MIYMPSQIATLYCFNTLQRLEHSLHAPETAASKNRNLSHGLILARGAQSGKSRKSAIF
jgi:hypothetical protein